MAGGLVNSPVFAILDGCLAEAGPLQKWGIPASVCAGGEDTVLWGLKGKSCLIGSLVFSSQVLPWGQTAFPSSPPQADSGRLGTGLCSSWGVRGWAKGAC